MPGLAKVGPLAVAKRGLVLLACVVSTLMGFGGPAVAEDGMALEVTGVQATAGQVEFFLAARGVPGSELTTRSVAVTMAGAPVPITVEQVVAGGTAPADNRPRGVVLVLDTSGSMADDVRLDTARAAATAYAAGLPADVELGLVTFSDTTTAALAPTTDRAAFTAALGRVAAKGATALYDGVNRALELLSPADRYAERRLVVLSDGADTNSTTTTTALRSSLAADKVIMDVVAVTAEAATTEVGRLAADTGGQLISATDAGAARRAFRALASALSAPVLVTAAVPPHLYGRTATLGVALTIPDGTAATEVSVRFGVDVGGAVAREYVTTTPVSRNLLFGGVASVGVALVVLCVVGLHAAVGRNAVRRRLRQIDAFTTDGRQTAAAPPEQQGNALLRHALELSKKAVDRNNQRGAIQATLDRAGIDLRPHEWHLIRAVVSVVGALVLLLLMPWWLGLPLGMCGGWFGTGLYRGMRESRRTRRFADLLPDALQLVVSALRSGFSLSQAIDAVVREGPEPINTEFGRAMAETRLGGEMEDALERTAVRNGSRDLAWLVMAIRIQREVGGNLSEVLETATDTMRERARLTRHVRGLSAEGRLSAWVLAGMPVLVASWMFISNGEYLRPLYTEPLGLAMLGGGVMMLCLGAFWMSRLVKVEV